MGASASFVRLAAAVLAGSVWVQACMAQASGEMVGQDRQTWQTWTQAIDAINKDKYDEANTLLTELAGKNLSPLRLALMADRTGTFRMAQAIKDNRLGEAANGLMQLSELGRRQRALAEDGWHYAAIGRFDLAKAHFEALVKESPDPVALLALANLNPNRHTILLQLMDRKDIGPAARSVLDLLQEGEFRLRTDPSQIIRNIKKLGGTARERLTALPKLKQSGEWSIPFMLDILLDAKQKPLHIHVVSALAEIGRSAVTPLALSLAMNNEPVKVFVIRTLGEIGYPHAAPYLKTLIESEDSSKQVKKEADLAIRAIEQISGKRVAGSAAEMFYNLAQAHYYDCGSLMAEPDAPVVNLWFWRDEQLTSTQVPPVIFNELMAMRSCESALQLKNDMPDAIALWLAANFKREAQLGVASVESEAADPATAKDPTKPDDYPRAIYFARAAGPQYNHVVLERGLRNGEPAVILGAIAALAETAGAASLIGSQDVRQPLVRALTYPNLIVRIKAALALGNVLPNKEFVGARNVVPALGEALAQTGNKHAIVIEPNQATRNRIVGILRQAGFLVVGGDNFYAVLEAAHKRAPSLDLIVLASDVKEPILGKALVELRKDYLFASAPTVILIKPADMAAVLRLTSLDERLGRVDWQAPATRLLAEYDRTRRQVGAMQLDVQAALDLALQAAATLRLIAITRNPVYDFRDAELALIEALNHPAEQLRVTAAAVLAISESSRAQQAIAKLGLDANQPKSIRIAAFGALADSAKTHGNVLSAELLEQVVAGATQGEDLEIRTAASRALGAANLPSNQSGQIIRDQALD